MTTQTKLLSPHTTGIATPRSDAFLSSGSSPTLHVLGAGAVGRAFVERLPDRPWRLSAWTDSGATVFDRAGLDATAALRVKTQRGRLSAHATAKPVATDVALSVVAADVLVDCTPTRIDEPSTKRTCAALDRGAFVALAAKDTLLADPLALLGNGRFERLGFNAVLGGTGLSLKHELRELRQSCRGFACVPNATTTFLIDRIERGADLDAALRDARALGFAESDATLDLDGTDAATKLTIVASLLSDTRRSISEIERGSLAFDAARIRERARAGSTTRLVGRLHTGGKLTLTLEALPRTSPLACPPSRFVYAYELATGDTRIHVGTGIGPAGTARALADDVSALVGGAR